MSNLSLDPVLTIVLPTYNRSTRLIKAIRSILDQKYDRVMIHVWDNHSTDDTEDVMNALASQHRCITYTRRPQNIGGLANYNDAISNVQTPYFIPLADDDWLLPNSLTTLVDAMEVDSDAAAVVSKTRHQIEDGAYARVNPGPEWDSGKYSPETLLPLWVERGHFEWSSIIFRSACVREIGGLDTGIGLPSDVDFQLRLFSRFPAKFIDQETAVYCQHADQSSVALGEMTRQQIAGIHRMVGNAHIIGTKSDSAIVRAAMHLFAKKWFKWVMCRLVQNRDIRASLILASDQTWGLRRGYQMLFLIYFHLRVDKFRRRLKRLPLFHRRREN